MKRFILFTLVFLIAPIMFAEVAWRTIQIFKPYDKWYSHAIQQCKTATADYVFIGSSRTAAAVDKDRFTNRIMISSGKQCRIDNFGRGKCTIVEHYFGIKRILESNPDYLRGAVVFVELPGGYPGEAIGGLPGILAWSDPWADISGGVWLISLYLRSDEIYRMWRISSASISDNVLITAASYLQGINGVAMIRAVIAYYGESVLNRFLLKAFGRGQPSSLTSDGGIRTDETGVRIVRDMARAAAKFNIDSQRVFNKWNEAVLPDFITLVRNAGASVCFYDVPLSSSFRKMLETPLMCKEKTRFADRYRSWGVPFVQTGFNPADAAFPDLYHLSKAVAPIFTDSLFDSYQRNIASHALVDSNGTILPFDRKKKFYD
ncbi:MAG: hypothetical protein V1913_17355 [Fibrobacterota bacterium]